jgi:hypothetical protein
MAIGAGQIQAIPLARAPVAAFAAPGAPVRVYVAQTETNWCWAACGEMIMQPAGINQTQCSLASKQFSLTCCPSPGAPSGCNQGCWPDLAYPASGLPTTRTTSPLSRARVSAELAAGRPVQVCYQWAGSSSTHVALIVDQYPNGDFEVFDPWPGYGQGRRQLSQIQSAYGLGSWIETFTF